MIFNLIHDVIINYLNDIMSVNIHMSYEYFLALCKIFDILRAQRLFINRKKTKFYISYDESLNILNIDIQNNEIILEISKIEVFNTLSSSQSF